MTGHVPFDATSDWANPYCGNNNSNDPLVDKLIGNAYHVVRTVYCNLGNLKLLYDYLTTHGMVVGVQSEVELKALPKQFAKFARIYNFASTGDRQVTDYLYVDDDATGIKPDDPELTGSWIKVAVSGSTGGGTGEGEGAYIPYVYQNGSATGGETSFKVPEGTVGVPFIIINGSVQYVGYGFNFDPATATVTLTNPLTQGDEVVALTTAVPANPDNPDISNWVQVNWLYNNGSATGGEQVITVPYTFKDVPAVYKNGERLYKGLPDKSYTIDTTTRTVTMTEILAQGDRVIITLGGESATLAVTDRTVQEVARANNVTDADVVLSTTTNVVITNKKIVYDVAAQKSWRLPALPPTAYIVKVENGKLTYNPGNVTVDLLPADNLQVVLDPILSRMAEESGYPMVGSFEQGGTISTATQSLGYKYEGRLYKWAGSLPKTVAADSSPETTGGISSTAWVRVDQDSLRDALGSANGADIIKYKKAGVNGSVINTLSTRYAHTLDAVADFGADPTGGADSADALIAWGAAMKNVPWCKAVIEGQFKVSKPVLIKDLTGITIYAQCYIYPTFTSGDYVFGICNAQGVRTHGRLEVSGQSKTGIKSGYKFWSDNANGFSFCEFYGICVSDATTGITLGDTAYPHALISELAFHGGYTVGTPCAIRAIGNQTYINFIGFNAVSGAPGDLSVVTQYTVHTKGANIMFIGGEIQHNDNVSGAAVLVEPIADITDGAGNNFGNSYGSIGVSNCHVETAAMLCMIANLDNVTSTLSDRSGVSFLNLRGYHSQNNGAMIGVHSSASEFAGIIRTDDIQLYCGVVRNQANIQAGNNTHVYYDPAGFGKNFVKGLQAVSGGILHFPRRVIWRAYNTNSQAIGTSPGVVNFATPQVSDDMYRWNGNYSAGRFTVPTGGLKDVVVEATIRVAAGTVQLDVYVDSAVKSLQSPSTSVTQTIRVPLGNLNAGQIIDVRASASASTTANGGDLESITIYAEN